MEVQRRYGRSRALTIGHNVPAYRQKDGSRSLAHMSGRGAVGGRGLDALSNPRGNQIGPTHGVRASRRSVLQADIDSGKTALLTTEERDELRRLRRENRVPGGERDSA
jgi:hypothetical protein